MKCPICGLINTESAQRCDCGYDFNKGTIEKPYYIPKPREGSKASKVLITAYIILPFIFYTIVIGTILIGVFGAPDLPVILSLIVIIVIYCGFFYFLYLQLRKRRNWARITLVIITFPSGWYFLGLTSQELKLYCHQREGLEKKR